MTTDPRPAKTGQLLSGSYTSLFLSPPLPLCLPHPSPSPPATLPVSPNPSPSSPYPPLAPSPPSNPARGLGALASGSGQSPAAKRMLVQWRPKLGICCWLRALQSGLLIVVVTIIYAAKVFFVNEQFNHFSTSCC